MATARPYRSSLRESQAAQTRERIIAAALKYLERHESDTLTLYGIGELAQVSAPTVYAHFPTLDALYLGIFHALQPRLGLEASKYPDALDKLPALPAARFPAYARNGKALSALLLAPGFHRARRSNREERLRGWVQSVKAAAPKLSAAEQQQRAYVMNAFWMPTMWHWLTESCELSTEEAARAASWAIDALVRALESEGALRVEAKGGKPGVSKGGNGKGKISAREAMVEILKRRARVW